MRRLANCLIAAAVLVAGMMALGSDTAEARRWIRPRRVVVAPRYPARYVSPRVGVDVPGARVYIYRRRGAVVVPGFRVGW